MAITQACMMVLAFVLAALTFTHAVQPWHVLVLASLLGVANSFDAPARQSFVSEMVAPEDLTNAIALNSTMFQTATVVGPAVAGVSYALFGPGWCFTINGISFIAVIAALLAMKLPPRAPRQRAESALAELREGTRYIRTQPTILVLISMIAVSSMFAISFGTLIPAWSVNVLGGGAEINGLLFSARGTGALLGALAIASLGGKIMRGRMLTAGSFLYPLLLAVLSLTRALPLSLLILAGVGVGTIFVNNLSNAMVQTSTPERLRGRVMGTYTWIFFGFMPLGALWSGMLASRLGEQTTVLINAGIAFLFALAIAVFYPRLRKE
jgi:MFS family permease